MDSAKLTDWIAIDIWSWNIIWALVQQIPSWWPWHPQLELAEVTPSSKDKALDDPVNAGNLINLGSDNPLRNRRARAQVNINSWAPARIQQHWPCIALKQFQSYKLLLTNSCQAINSSSSVYGSIRFPATHETRNSNLDSDNPSICLLDRSS
jgi:hypothetical protein